MSLETYHITTFGCQMNAYDSELMAGILEARGLRPAPSEDDADVLLFNTCIVRGSAEQRAVGRIGRLRPIKERHPERILGVCGCLAQRDAHTIFETAPHVDLVLGTRAFGHLSALLDRVQNGERPVACVDEAADPYDIQTVAVRRGGLKALVPIMTGCDNWCSYCIVPAVRGRESSRPAGSVIDEIRSLASTGCREATLVGQNVNSYRDGDTDFAELLGRVAEIEDLWRIRYITSHPRDAGERHLDAVANLGKVCDHFHLPAQSGSTRVLERMNRGYTREHYLDLIESVRKHLPDAAITTDLIVGFPGETDADYRETLSLVEEVQFDAAFTFLYNVREGTRAAEWGDDVSLEVKKERLAALIELQEDISLEKNRAWEGREVEVLTESRARRADQPDARGNMMGRTTGDKCVIYHGDAEDVGRLVNVRITEGAAHTLFGEKTRPEAAR